MKARVLVLSVPLIAALTHHWLFAGWWCLGLVVLYAYSIWRMETVTCWACDGGRKFSHRGILAALWPRARRGCWRCNGKGEWVRWGVRVFRRDRARELAGK